MYNYQQITHINIIELNGADIPPEFFVPGHTLLKVKSCLTNILLSKVIFIVLGK